jgi:hypothetical protein
VQEEDEAEQDEEEDRRTNGYADYGCGRKRVLRNCALELIFDPWRWARGNGGG